MKHATGSGTADGDLEPATFAALEQVFPGLDALVLNGIGEPLLHPRLEQFVTRAKKRMPARAWVGFQTNGVLLTRRRARSLADAGVDRICLSLDGASADTFRAIREGGELGDLESALAALAAARKVSGRSGLQVGVEFVLRRDNLRELPAALRWAAGRGASFALVSHLLPYDETHAGQCAFDLCTDEALDLYRTWRQRAEGARLDLHRYFEVLWTYNRSPQEQAIVDCVEAMKAEALRRNVTLDLRRLLTGDGSRLGELSETFAEAREAALEAGLELRLPAAVPRARRQCDFVEQGGAFITWDGKVHPCYYLWHACRSFAGGWLHPVRPRVFGSLAERDLLEIWNSPEFRAFRQNVEREDYPFCPGCNFAPCDLIQAEPFVQDCYVNNEPCGACLWGAGLFHCLS